MINLSIEVLRHGVFLATESRVIGRRHELVRVTDSLIEQWQLSTRARRQANLVLIWRYLNARGFWQWRLRDTMGAGIEIQFSAVI
jgi:hypothetical protein